MKPDFSKLTPIYDLLGSALFFGALRRSQTYFLNDLPKIKKALILGGGTGTFLIDFIRKVDVESIDYIDISPGMIAKAKKKADSAGLSEKVNFICGSEKEIPETAYDFICTNYFLDCFNDDSLLELMPVLKGKLSKGGNWLFTDFYLDRKPSFFRRNFVRFLYFFFSVTCGLRVKELPDFDKHFEEKIKKRERFFCGGILRSVLWS
jgi:tRNA (cmo5U34)-methyltransferase